MSGNGMPRRAPSARKRARHHAARMQQRAQQQLQVNAWIQQYGWPGSGRLERDELAVLLQHLHQEAGVPDPRALDLLIIQATEVRAFSLTLKGDPNGAVSKEQLMAVVSGYSTYLLASAAFERRACEGVVQLRDLPALMREANSGQAYDHREVDFVLDCTSSSVGGHLDAASALGREDVVPAMAVMAYTGGLDTMTGGLDPGGTGLIMEEEDSTGTNDEGGSGPGSAPPPSEEDLELERQFDDIEVHLARLEVRYRGTELIQAYARRLAAIKFFHKARWAVTLIQSAARGRLARSWLQQRKSAAALIVRIARVKPAKRQAQRRREAATVITKVAKGKVTRKLMNAARSTTNGFVRSLAVAAPVRSRCSRASHIRTPPAPTRSIFLVPTLALRPAIPLFLPCTPTPPSALFLALPRPAPLPSRAGQWATSSA